MTLRVRISAAAVSAEPDEGWMGVSIAEHSDGSGWTLHLQRGWTEPDDQDVRLGQDTYSLVDGEGRTHYGGVIEACAAAQLLSLRLSPQAADVLDLGDMALELQLDLASQAISELREGLRRVLTYGRADEHPERLTL
jgi:hypothetical protein